MWERTRQDISQYDLVAFSTTIFVSIAVQAVLHIECKVRPSPQRTIGCKAGAPTLCRARQHTRRQLLGAMPHGYLNDGARAWRPSVQANIATQPRVAVLHLKQALAVVDIAAPHKAVLHALHCSNLHPACLCCKCATFKSHPVLEVTETSCSRADWMLGAALWAHSSVAMLDTATRTLAFGNCMHARSAHLDVPFSSVHAGHYMLPLSRVALLRDWNEMHLVRSIAGVPEARNLHVIDVPRSTCMYAFETSDHARTGL
jgi:hypothetical protein